jgi:hypothetical protein
MEYKDGHLFVNGKDFDEQLNTGKQMELAIEIASHGAVKLPLIITDRAESWDEEATKYVMDAVRDAGMQIVMTKVAEVPYAIEGIN